MQNPEHILITGASSGIGAALARCYARLGVSLVLTGRDEGRLQQVTQSCRGQGAETSGFAIDVTDRAAMKDMIEKVDHDRSFDLVIANAGISGGTGGGGESDEQVRKIFDVNLNGVMNTIEPALPGMMARRKGQVALMSSLASFSGWPGAPAYSASKGAVRLYGEALRGSMMGTGVQVSVICPGFIRTPMTDVNDYAMPFMMDAEKAARVIAKGLAVNKGRIAFPWQTYFLAGFFGVLPHWLSSSIFTKLPEKPSSEP